MIIAWADVPHEDCKNYNTQEAKEDAQWLEDDWFTSGETSWEEYYHEEKIK
jgi:hypothetical protein